MLTLNRRCFQLKFVLMLTSEGRKSFLRICQGGCQKKKKNFQSK